MRAFGDLAAVHLTLCEQKNESPTKLRVSLPDDQWKAAIIELCWRRFEYCLHVHNSALSVYLNDLRRREVSDGRVVDRLPVRLSWGIGQVADLLKTFESNFETFTSLIDTCRKRATFGNETAYDSLSRQWLRQSRDLRNRIELSLQTSMWVQWITESLWQAAELAFHFNTDDTQYFKQYGSDMFSYIAHPPLLVAVLTSATMVEEVGAVTVKKLNTEVDPDLTNTQLEEVIKWLREEELAPDYIDLDVLDDTLREARNELAHSMTARRTTVTLASFETYVKTVQMAVDLGLNLANLLAADVLIDLKDLPLTPDHR